MLINCVKKNGIGSETTEHRNEYQDIKIKFVTYKEYLHILKQIRFKKVRNLVVTALRMFVSVSMGTNSSFQVIFKRTKLLILRIAEYYLRLLVNTRILYLKNYDKIN